MPKVLKEYNATYGQHDLKETGYQKNTVNESRYFSTSSSSSWDYNATLETWQCKSACCNLIFPESEALAIDTVVKDIDKDTRRIGETSQKQLKQSTQGKVLFPKGWRLRHQTRLDRGRSDHRSMTRGLDWSSLFFLVHCLRIFILQWLGNWGCWTDFIQIFIISCRQEGRSGQICCNNRNKIRSVYWENHPA